MTEEQDSQIIHPRLSTYSQIFSISEMIFCSIACLMNLAVLFFLVWDIKSTLKRTNLILTLNLAIWDFLFAAYMFGTGAKKWIVQTSFINNTDCLWEGAISTMLGMSAFISISLLALDRYYTVVMKKLLEQRTCFLGIFLSILWAMITGVSPLFFDSEKGYILQPSGYYCLIDLKRQNPNTMDVVYPVAVFYVICVLTSLFCYFEIVRTVKTTSNVLGKLWKHPKERIEVHPSPRAASSEPKEFHKLFKNVLLSKFHMHSTLQAPKSSITALTSTTISTGSNHLSSKTEKTGSQNHLNFMKSRRFVEFQLTQKTFYLGLSRFIIFTPFAVLTVLQLCQFTGLEILDIVAIHFFFLALILDPCWTLVMDQQIKKIMIKFKDSIKAKTKNFFS